MIGDSQCRLLPEIVSIVSDCAPTWISSSHRRGLYAVARIGHGDSSAPRVRCLPATPRAVAEDDAPPQLLDDLAKEMACLRPCVPTTISIPLMPADVPPNLSLDANAESTVRTVSFNSSPQVLATHLSNSSGGSQNCMTTFEVRRKLQTSLRRSASQTLLRKKKAPRSSHYPMPKTEEGAERGLRKKIPRSSVQQWRIKVGLDDPTVDYRLEEEVHPLSIPPLHEMTGTYHPSPPCTGTDTDNHPLYSSHPQ